MQIFGKQGHHYFRHPGRKHHMKKSEQIVTFLLASHPYPIVSDRKKHQQQQQKQCDQN